MSQNKQIQRVKMYRVLKVLFYGLGLPLFVAAVFFASVKMIGHNPFIGTSTGLLGRYQMILSAPALYGVYIAAAIWLFSAIVHLILSKTVKNRRVVRFVVVAITLVAMLGTALVMDFTMGAKINDMIALVESDDSPYADGVYVQDYKTQLSYYRTLTSGSDASGLIMSQIDKIETLLKAYNVGMKGGSQGGNAANMSNNAMYYDQLIDDDGNVGVDIGYKDGKLDVVEEGKELIAREGLLSSTYFYYAQNNVVTGDGDRTNDHALVRLVPNENGQLEINGKVYSHYYYLRRQPNNVNDDPDLKAVYYWYSLEYAPVYTVDRDKDEPSIVTVRYQVQDGIYGEGVYNTTGLLIDGWVFGLDNVLEILEDYYAKDSIVAKAIEESDGIQKDASAWHNQVITNATAWRDAYYKGERPDANGKYATLYEQALYQQDVTIRTENHSLTRGELDGLLAQVGALLGDNSLFDFLLAEDGLLGSILGPILNDLKTGLDLGALINNEGTMGTVCEVFEVLTGDTDINNIFIVLQYPNEDTQHLLVEVYKNSVDAEKANLLLDIDFDKRLLGQDPDNPDNPDYAFDLDHLDNFLNTALNNALKKFNISLTDGIVATILDLVTGLLPIDLSQYNLINDAGEFTIDIGNILTSVLEGFYWYQSAYVKPIYEFYVNPNAEAWEQAGQKAFADYDRAYYTGSLYGSMIGSTLIGDSLGTGKYPSSFGLTSLAAVQQTKLDLSYIKTYYPLYGLRDMLYMFAGFVVLFMFLSFVCAEKEFEFATGQAIVKQRKSKKKKSKESDAVAEDAQSTEATNAPTDNKVGEDTQIPQDQKSKKEVR